MNIWVDADACPAVVKDILYRAAERAQVIERGGDALDPRGELYSPDTIRERLTMRDFMEGLRESGVQTGGPPPLAHGDRQRFANQLDRWLAQAQGRQEQQ